MMSLKQVGYPFPIICADWKPRHPARWCWGQWMLAVVRYRDIYGPFVRSWQCDAHVWTCYMRIRWPWITKIGWRRFLASPYDHAHRDFRDIVMMGRLVNGAEDPFINAHYEVNVHTDEGRIIPWSQDERLR